MTGFYVLKKHTPILVMCLIFKLCKMFEFELSELFFTFFLLLKLIKKITSILW